MYKILEEFTMKYRKNSEAVFTEETAEKILKAGKFIEKIEEPKKEEVEEKIEKPDKEKAEEKIVEEKVITKE